MHTVKYQRNLPNNLFRFFDDPATRNFQFGNHNTSDWPAANIQETEAAYHLALVAPGRVKENFKIELNDQLLTISYEDHTEQDGNTPTYLRQEFKLVSFRRSFRLNEKVIDDEQIAATYDAGVLHLSLPKRAEALAKGTKVINIG